MFAVVANRRLNETDDETAPLEQAFAGAEHQSRAGGLDQARGENRRMGIDAEVGGEHALATRWIAIRQGIDDFAALECTQPFAADGAFALALDDRDPPSRAAASALT